MIRMVLQSKFGHILYHWRQMQKQAINDFNVAKHTTTCELVNEWYIFIYLSAWFTDRQFNRCSIFKLRLVTYVIIIVSFIWFFFLNWGSISIGSKYRLKKISSPYRHQLKLMKEIVICIGPKISMCTKVHRRSVSRRAPAWSRRWRARWSWPAGPGGTPGRPSPGGPQGVW